MNSFEEKVYNYVLSRSMLKRYDRIVVGVSGGADSVCLLLILKKITEHLNPGGNDVVAVHVNHMIRGAEADEDTEFVKALCDRLGVECRVYYKDIKGLAAEQGCTVEEAGRNYRYECFKEVMRECDCNVIAVAHNKNDNIETMIFNMLRGSGLRGMTGISEKRGHIIRPLIFAKRSEIEEYLAKEGEVYRTDSTNLTTEYDRNKIRHVLLPAMLDINSLAIEHLEELAAEAEKSYDYISSNADIAYISREKGAVSFLISELEKKPEVVREYIIHEAISHAAGMRKDITRRHVAALLELTQSDTGKMVNLPYSLVARRSYDKLIIELPRKREEACEVVIEPGNSYDVMGHGRLYTSLLEKNKDYVISRNNYAKAVNYDKIKGMVCMRTPKAGDYMVIDGNGNTKKLSRIFIDNKIDRGHREHWPVVACGNEIIWAIGLRYNVAYKLTDETQKILLLEYKGE